MSDVVPASKAYWILTGLVCLSQGASGIMDLAGAEQIMEGLAALGYPAYVATILGVWKLGAALTLLAPGIPLIKEWAYAGLFFDLTGAFSSHYLNGDGPADLAPPLIVLALVIGSYLLRPADRRLV